MDALLGKPEAKPVVSFYLCCYLEGSVIVSASCEQEAYKLVTADDWPENDEPHEEWECLHVNLTSGEVFDLERYI